MRKILYIVDSENGISSGLLKRKTLADNNSVDSERDCNYHQTFQNTKQKNNLLSFIFNFMSQSLYHNAMIAHFVQDFDATCQRCERWDCPKINDILRDCNQIISNGVS